MLRSLLFLFLIGFCHAKDRQRELRKAEAELLFAQVSKELAQKYSGHCFTLDYLLFHIKAPAEFPHNKLKKQYESIINNELIAQSRKAEEEAEKGAEKEAEKEVEEEAEKEAEKKADAEKILSAPGCLRIQGLLLWDLTTLKESPVDSAYLYYKVYNLRNNRDLQLLNSGVNSRDKVLKNLNDPVYLSCLQGSDSSGTQGYESSGLQGREHSDSQKCEHSDSQKYRIALTQKILLPEPFKAAEKKSDYLQTLLGTYAGQWSPEVFYHRHWLGVELLVSAYQEPENQPDRNGIYRSANLMALTLDDRAVLPLHFRISRIYGRGGHSPFFVSLLRIYREQDGSERYEPVALGLTEADPAALGSEKVDDFVRKIESDTANFYAGFSARRQLEDERLDLLLLVSRKQPDFIAGLCLYSDRSEKGKRDYAGAVEGLNKALQRPFAFLDYEDSNELVDKTAEPDKISLPDNDCIEDDYTACSYSHKIDNIILNGVGLLVRRMSISFKVRK